MWCIVAQSVRLSSASAGLTRGIHTSTRTRLSSRGPQTARHERRAGQGKGGRLLGWLAACSVSVSHAGCCCSTHAALLLMTGGCCPLFGVLCPSPPLRGGAAAPLLCRAASDGSRRCCAWGGQPLSLPWLLFRGKFPFCLGFVPGPCSTPGLPQTTDGGLTDTTARGYGGEEGRISGGQHNNVCTPHPVGLSLLSPASRIIVILCRSSGAASHQRPPASPQQRTSQTGPHSLCCSSLSLSRCRCSATRAPPCRGPPVLKRKPWLIALVVPAVCCVGRWVRPPAHDGPDGRSRVASFPAASSFCRCSRSVLSVIRLPLFCWWGLAPVALLRSRGPDRLSILAASLRARGASTQPHHKRRVGLSPCRDGPPRRPGPPPPHHDGTRAVRACVGGCWPGGRAATAGTPPGGPPLRRLSLSGEGRGRGGRGHCSCSATPPRTGPGPLAGWPAGCAVVVGCWNYRDDRQMHLETLTHGRLGVGSPHRPVALGTVPLLWFTGLCVSPDCIGGSSVLPHGPSQDIHHGGPRLCGGPVGVRPARGARRAPLPPAPGRGEGRRPRGHRHMLREAAGPADLFTRAGGSRAGRQGTDRRPIGQFPRAGRLPGGTIPRVPSHKRGSRRAPGSATRPDRPAATAWPVHAQRLLPCTLDQATNNRQTGGRQGAHHTPLSPGPPGEGPAPQSVRDSFTRGTPRRGPCSSVGTGQPAIDGRKKPDPFTAGISARAARDCDAARQEMQLGRRLTVPGRGPRLGRAPRARGGAVPSHSPAGPPRAAGWPAVGRPWRTRGGGPGGGLRSPRSADF